MRQYKIGHCEKFCSTGLLAVCCLLSCAFGCRLTGRGEMTHQLAACRTLSQRGVAAIEAQRWDEAETLMSEAVEACPSDVDAKRYYAEALWHRGKRAEAIAQLKVVANSLPDDAAVRVRLGEMLLAGGHLSSAYEQAEAAVDLAPNKGGVWTFRARVLKKKGLLQRALADYQRSLAYRPDDREVLFETAEIYRQLNKPHEALAVLNSLSDTYPLGEEPAEVVRLRDLALAAQGRPAMAGGNGPKIARRNNVKLYDVDGKKETVAR